MGNKLAIIKTYPDEKYKSETISLCMKYLILLMLLQFILHSTMIMIYIWKFDEIEILDNTDKVYFSMTYNDSLIIGQRMNIKLYQLQIDFKRKK